VTAEKGKVYLVGAGPGDPEQLTVSAHLLISSADYIFHDDLVPHRFSRWPAAMLRLSAQVNAAEENPSLKMRSMRPWCRQQRQVEVWCVSKVATRCCLAALEKSLRHYDPRIFHLRSQQASVQHLRRLPPSRFPLQIAASLIESVMPFRRELCTCVQS